MPCVKVKEMESEETAEMKGAEGVSFSSYFLCDLLVWMEGSRSVPSCTL